MQPSYTMHRVKVSVIKGINQTFPELATPFHKVRNKRTQQAASEPTSFKSGIPIPLVISGFSFNTELLKYCSAELITD